MEKTNKDSMLDIDEPRDKVAGHLESPKKKKRDFAVLAFSSYFDRDLSLAIESYIRANYKFLTIVKPRSKKDLGVMANKNVTLILIDDKFLWDESVFEELISIKSKRNSSIPVLFFTDDENRLVQDYRNHMSAFQEVDSFVSYRNLSNDQILARVRRCIKFKNRRASKRFKVEIPVRYYNLTDDKEYKGKLVDISIHGAVLEDDSGKIFKMNNQLRLSIPVDGAFKYSNGEFFKMSAKVRRVLIGGNKAGVSWEYLSEDHQIYITKYVIVITERIMRKEARKVSRAM